MQGPARGWGVALASYGFPRGSGIHRWRVRLDSVNRRGHVFLGVATRQTALGSYLGADRHGWGYLVSQDLYHGGSRLRSGYGSRMLTGMTVELTLNTDIGVLSVGNTDTGEDFGPAMNNLYEDIGGVAGGGISLGVGGSREARIDGRSAASLSTANAAAAAAAAATPIGGGGGRGGDGIDPQGTLWPAFAMHQPGDSVTFLPRRADDGYDMPRTVSSSSAAAAAAAGGGGGYRSLQGLMSGGGGGLTDGVVGGGGGGPGGGAVATQALPLGYANPILVEHVCAALKTATGVLREAGQGMRDEGGDETDDSFCVVAR